jgi:hypothetical protein
MAGGFIRIENFIKDTIYSMVLDIERVNIEQGSTIYDFRSNALIQALDSDFHFKILYII